MLNHPRQDRVSPLPLVVAAAHGVKGEWREALSALNQFYPPNSKGRQKFDRAFEIAEKRVEAP
jgi:hypothetical protein